jgi:hypothetical protein
MKGLEADLHEFHHIPVYHFRREIAICFAQHLGAAAEQ